jgi:uncharacterized protein YbbK (DUF523 family)
MTERIRLGVSSCLLGADVRFDGGHKHDRFLTDTLGQYVEFVPVCPEVECGLGVPQESMRLVGNPQSPHLVTIRTPVDHTDRMLSLARKRVKELEKEDLCGFIFKNGSPSSGMERVKVRNEKGMPEKKGGGDVYPGVHGLFSSHSGGGGRPASRSKNEGELYRAYLQEGRIHIVACLRSALFRFVEFLQKPRFVKVCDQMLGLVIRGGSKRSVEKLTNRSADSVRPSSALLNPSPVKKATSRSVPRWEGLNASMQLS